RGRDQGLRFATGEDGRAVRPRQHADFTRDVAKLPRVAAVHAHPFEDQVADDALFEVFEGRGDLLRRMSRLAVFGKELIEDLFAQFSDPVGTLVLAGGLFAVAQLVVKALAEDNNERVDGRGYVRRLRTQAGFLPQLFDQVHDAGDRLVGVANRL